MDQKTINTTLLKTDFIFQTIQNRMRGYQFKSTGGDKKKNEKAFRALEGAGSDNGTSGVSTPNLIIAATGIADEVVADEVPNSDEMVEKGFAEKAEE